MVKKSNTVGLVLVAAAAGAVAGVLLAPKRGAESRQELKDKYNNAKNKTQDAAMDTKEKINRGIDAARGKVNDAADKTKDIADEAAGKLKNATSKAERTLADEIQAEASKRNRPTL